MVPCKELFESKCIITTPSGYIKDQGMFISLKNDLYFRIPFKHNQWKRYSTSKLIIDILDALASRSLNYSDKNSITINKQKLVENNTNTIYLSETHLSNSDNINHSNKLIEVKNFDCSSNKISDISVANRL